MRQEIDNLIVELKETYDGDPWFGKSIKVLLDEVDEKTVFKKINGQHCIAELLFHMITWREFTINCLQPSPNRHLKYFEERDWQTFDGENILLWQQGLQRLEQTQLELIRLLEKQEDSLLEKIVHERQYNFRKLLTGIVQHDIYHLGQIAFINKALRQAL